RGIPIRRPPMAQDAVTAQAFAKAQALAAHELQVLGVQAPSRERETAFERSVMPGEALGRAHLPARISITVLAHLNQRRGQLHETPAQRHLREERAVGTVERAVQQRALERVPAHEPEEIDT